MVIITSSPSEPLALPQHCLVCVATCDLAVACVHHTDTLTCVSPSSECECCLFQTPHSGNTLPQHKPIFEVLVSAVPASQHNSHQPSNIRSTQHHHLCAWGRLVTDISLVASNTTSDRDSHHCEAHTANTSLLQHSPRENDTHTTVQNLNK
ncbi:hypothetical protein E2C01_066669 [Portunus trituberculatus]|uniref:Uncharacterized protein n=1 Tax=Portunus trituberculatus TaxID=210409 RepID=A0A5B7HRK8_PORTR|nr:hypothetical protein [Portunus trituberculatus]